VLSWIQREFLFVLVYSQVLESLNLKPAKLKVVIGNMDKDSVLVEITASREKGEIVYRVDCSSELSNEEFEYYLSEIINGICKWKKGICDENIRSYKGRLKRKKK
jgi:hypothetical protein